MERAQMNILLTGIRSRETVASGNISRIELKREVLSWVTRSCQAQMTDAPAPHFKLILSFSCHRRTTRTYIPFSAFWPWSKCIICSLLNWDWRLAPDPVVARREVKGRSNIDTCVTVVAGTGNIDRWIRKVTTHKKGFLSHPALVASTGKHHHSCSASRYFDRDESFVSFYALFYMGKGARSREFQHWISAFLIDLREVGVCVVPTSPWQLSRGQSIFFFTYNNMHNHVYG